VLDFIAPKAPPPTPPVCIAVVHTKMYNRHRKEVFPMAKSANIYARIEPEVKAEAEKILEILGIPASNAITMFYKQIILNRGLPFEVKIPSPSVPNLAELTEEELEQEILKGYEDYLQGRTKPATDVLQELKKDYEL
jgi:DNA-damage-inducible protein J